MSALMRSEGGSGVVRLPRLADLDNGTFLSGADREKTVLKPAVWVVANIM